MKGLFDLASILGDEFLESTDDDSIGNMSIEEAGEHEIPEKPTAKMEGDTTGSLPGEQPAMRPKDETKIMTGNGTEIKADVYNSAMGALKKSFKEASELIDMLSNCTVV